ncbi:MAG TPA: asparagine synthase (glutamine-hydrolyzing) [Acidimicrobiales bacterium]|nr:asparagine synthase (glutamine-hydrolyzing) [Acidimicrobiales bacterium]
MCGIAGLVHTEGVAPEGGALATMAARLSHRGPDAAGQRTFPQCSLAHTRLRILDLSPAADQPLANEDETVWVVFNGEIYNFAELRDDLAAAGHRFRTHTDSEVLVHLYEEHGDDLVHRLRGMFAFAVWDERRRRLLLARDRLGIKPLYYRPDGRGLRFASETQALAEPGDDLDAGALAGFLRLGWVPGPATVRAGVRELPPGHRLTWEGGAAEVARWWSPPAAAAGDGEAELADALHDAVARHLVADVPVGLFLSSGVDSAVVGALAARAGSAVRGYTVAFDTGPDEAAGAAALAARVGIDHVVVRTSGADVLGAMDAVVGAMDQPTVDGVNSWVVSRAVRQAGAVVALSGLGGDELFGGYSTFRHVPRLVRAGRAASALPAPARRAVDAAAGAVPPMAHSRARRAAEAAAAGGWGDAYAAVRGLFGAGELHDLCPGAANGRSHPVQVPPGDGLSGAAMVGRLEVANYLPYQLLRDTDCMSMAHALEVRVPLLDDRVVAVAAARTWGKDRLVAATDPGLAALVGRPKQTFTLPFDRWMRGPLATRVLGSLDVLGDAGLGFDRRRLSELWFAYGARRVGWRPVWALAVLGAWLERHATAATGLAA